MATNESPLIYQPEPAQTIYDVAALLRFLRRHPLEPEDRHALGSILELCAAALSYEAERIRLVDVPPRRRGAQNG